MRWASLPWEPVPWDFALILLVLGVLVPWRATVRIKQLLARPRVETVDRLAIYASTIAFQWLAVGFVAWRCYVRGITAQHLGLAFPTPELTTATALGLSLLLGANQLFSLLRMARLPPQRRGVLHQVVQKLLPHNLVEALAFLALATTVALCEEFLYRGFVFLVLQNSFAGSALLAAIGSSALFALAHLYQGRRGLGATFLVGLIFAAARILTASLAPPILAHLVVDVVAGLAAPRMLAEPTVAAGQSVPAARSPHGPGGNP